MYCTVKAFRSVLLRDKLPFLQWDDHRFFQIGLLIFVNDGNVLKKCRVCIERSLFMQTLKIYPIVDYSVSSFQCEQNFKTTIALKVEHLQIPR